MHFAMPSILYLVCQCDMYDTILSLTRSLTHSLTHSQPRVTTMIGNCICTAQMQSTTLLANSLHTGAIPSRPGNV